MMRKNIKKKRDYSAENIRIERLSSEGKGIAKIEGKVVFVEKGLPEDVVNLSVFSIKKNYDEARITEIIEPSPDRIEPYCGHFSLCGGCKMQHLNYPRQLVWKTQILTDALDRLGNCEYPKPLPIIGNETVRYYRNKLDFAASNKKWIPQSELAELPENTERNGIGFHLAGMFQRIVDIETCYHMPEPMNEIRNEINRYAQAIEMPFFDLKLQTGNLRNILIRNTQKGEWLVCISFTEYDEKAKRLMQHLKEGFPQIQSLLYVVNTKANDTIYDLDIQLFAGQPYIEEFLNELKFVVRPKSFFQTNTKQCVVLYDQIKQMAGLTGKELLYDLYCGVGSIGLYLADKARKIIGVELVEDAVADARINAQANGIDHAAFFAADMHKLFQDEFIQKHGKPDVLITDPPRSGMHPKVIDQLLRLECPRIVYVSCHAQHLATDLNRLAEKYKIIAIQPVDMFPQTAHLETVVLLELRAH